VLIKTNTCTERALDGAVHVGIV